jgi:hypothetical protein
MASSLSMSERRSSTTCGSSKTVARAFHPLAGEIIAARVLIAAWSSSGCVDGSPRTAREVARRFIFEEVRGKESEDEDDEEADTRSQPEGIIINNFFL